jgi:hypothetical protein
MSPHREQAVNLTKADLDTLIQVCRIHESEMEAEMRRQASEGVSVSAIRSTLACIDDLARLRNKLVEMKKSI